MTLHPFTIRPATPTDSLALQQLFSDCRALAWWLPTAVRFAANFKQESSGEEVTVAVDQNGELLGLLSVFKPEAFIHHLYVRPSDHRRGIGRGLLADLGGRLPLPWRLKCPPGNLSALKFYDSLGWWEVTRGSGPWGEYLLLEFSGPPVSPKKCR